MNEITDQVKQIVARLADRDYVGVLEAHARLATEHGGEAIEGCAAVIGVERLFHGLEVALEAARGKPNRLAGLERDLAGLANAWHPADRMVTERGLDWVNEHLISPYAGRLPCCPPEFLPFMSRGACPRCAGALERFPGDRGAVSRIDEETAICGACGTDEAHVQSGQRPKMQILPAWAARSTLPRSSRSAES